MSRMTGRTRIARGLGALAIVSAGAAAFAFAPGCGTYQVAPDWTLFREATWPGARHVTLVNRTRTFRFDPDVPLVIDVPRGYVRVRGVAADPGDPTGPFWAGSGPRTGEITHPYEGPDLQGGMRYGAAPDPEARADIPADARPGRGTRDGSPGFDQGTLRVGAALRLIGRSKDESQRRAGSAGVALVREVDRQVLRMVRPGFPFEADVAHLDIRIDRPVRLSIITGVGNVETIATDGDLQISTSGGAIRVRDHVGNVIAQTVAGSIDFEMGRSAARDASGYRRDRGYTIAATAIDGTVSVDWPRGYRPMTLDVISGAPPVLGGQAGADVAWSEYVSAMRGASGFDRPADPVSAELAECLASTFARPWQDAYGPMLDACAAEAVRRCPSPSIRSRLEVELRAALALESGVRGVASGGSAELLRQFSAAIDGWLADDPGRRELLPVAERVAADVPESWASILRATVAEAEATRTRGLDAILRTTSGDAYQRSDYASSLRDGVAELLPGRLEPILAAAVARATADSQFVAGEAAGEDQARATNTGASFAGDPGLRETRIDARFSQPYLSNPMPYLDFITEFLSRP